MKKDMDIIIGCMRLGNWGANYSTEAYGDFIEACLDLGANTFDHADIYGDYTTEEEFGRVLKRVDGLRQKIRLITKCGIRRVCDARPQHQIKSYDSSAAHVIRSVEQSLENLRTDHIDMLLLHRPDYLMDPAELAEAFTRLKADGKVLEFGVSNFSRSQFELLHCYFPLSAHQIEISLLHLDPFEDGLLDHHLQHDVAVQAWSPLGGGEFFRKDRSDRAQRVYVAACEMQDSYGVSTDQILLAWLSSHPVHIQPIIGSTKIERVKSAIEASKLELSREDWYRLWQASTGQRLP